MSAFQSSSDPTAGPQDNQASSADPATAPPTLPSEMTKTDIRTTEVKSDARPTDTTSHAQADAKSNPTDAPADAPTDPTPAPAPPQLISVDDWATFAPDLRHESWAGFIRWLKLNPQPNSLLANDQWTALFDVYMHEPVISLGAILCPTVTYSKVFSTPFQLSRATLTLRRWRYRATDRPAIS